jgi:hypothetical protein
VAVSCERTGAAGQAGKAGFPAAKSTECRPVSWASACRKAEGAESLATRRQKRGVYTTCHRSDRTGGTGRPRLT